MDTIAVRCLTVAQKTHDQPDEGIFECGGPEQIRLLQNGGTQSTQHGPRQDKNLGLRKHGIVVDRIAPRLHNQARNGIETGWNPARGCKAHDYQREALAHPAVAGEGFDQYTHHLPHRFRRRAGRDPAERRTNPHFAALPLALHQVLQNGVPVREILIERADRKPGFFRDAIGGQCRLTLLPQNLSGGFEDDADRVSRARLRRLFPNRNKTLIIRRHDAPDVLECEYQNRALLIKFANATPLAAAGPWSERCAEFKKGDEMNRNLTTLALMLAITVPSAANAASAAFAVANVNLRAGPGTAYPVVTTLFAGSAVTLHGCMANLSWCDIGWAGNRGWVAASYIRVEYNGNTIVITPSTTSQLNITVVSFNYSYWQAHYAGRHWYGHWDNYHGSPRHAHGAGVVACGPNACRYGSVRHNHDGTTIRHGKIVRP